MLRESSGRLEFSWSIVEKKEKEESSWYSLEIGMDSARRSSPRTLMREIISIKSLRPLWERPRSWRV